MKPGSAAWRRSKRRREMQLRPEVAALIALSFAVFIDNAHAWVSLSPASGILPEGMRQGAVAALWWALYEKLGRLPTNAELAEAINARK